MKLKIKTGDTVFVIAGKERRKKGKVLKVFPVTGQVIVEGVNVAKKHKKRRSAQDPGEIVDKPMPINISNVMLADEKTDKPTRVGYKVDKDGRKTRIAKKSKSEIANA
jgi:large subunit ribosomal protein L24